MTSVNGWEKKVLASPGAPGRVAQIEEELRLAAGLTRLREQAGLSQRELAERIGVRQPRIAAIERSRNVTFDVLERYVGALGGRIELSVVKDGATIALIPGHRKPTPTKKAAKKDASGKQESAKNARAKPKAATKMTSPKRSASKKTA